MVQTELFLDLRGKNNFVERSKNNFVENLNWLLEYKILLQHCSYHFLISKIIILMAEQNYFHSFCVAKFLDTSAKPFFV